MVTYTYSAKFTKMSYAQHLSDHPGLIVTVGQRLILVMWKERSASPTHALHMGFGIGAVLIPLIANPFLMVVQPLDSNHTDSSTIMTTSNSSSVVTVMASTPAPPRFLPLKADNSPSNTTFDGHFFSTNITSARNDYQVISDSNVHYVFILVACLSFLSCLPFILYQSLNSEKCNPVFRQITDNEIKNTKKIRFLDMLNPASYTGGSMAFGITMFTLIFVYFTGTVGGEQLFGTFIRTFSVDLLQFSKDSASYLLMVYWLSFTLSRFLGSILSHLIHIKHLIVVQAIFNTASVTALNFLRKTSTNLWVFTCIQGVLYAPLYPMGISFANTVMDVRGFCLTVVSLAASLGDFGYIWIAGKLYDQFGPNGIMYTMQASGITILIAVCGFRLASWGRKAPDAKQFHTAPEKLEMSVNHAKRSEEITGLLDTSEDEL